MLPAKKCYVLCQYSEKPRGGPALGVVYSLPTCPQWTSPEMKDTLCRVNFVCSWKRLMNSPLSFACVLESQWSSMSSKSSTWWNLDTLRRIQPGPHENLKDSTVQAASCKHKQIWRPMAHLQVGVCTEAGQKSCELQPSPSMSPMQVVCLAIYTVIDLSDSSS